MKFCEAYEALKQGALIKCPEWAGYWKWENDSIKIYCKDGTILDIRETIEVDYTINFLFREEWEFVGPDVKELNIQTVTFGEAIRRLKKGQQVSRKGWNRKGIFIELQVPDQYSKMTHPYIYIDTTGLKTDNPDAPKDRVPWLASQTDMLAEDWIVVM